MAGTRGLAQFKGLQLQNKAMRDRHFDEANKINENKIDIKWHEHREILEDTKIDVFSQVNNKVVANLSSINITSDLGGKPLSTGATVEGVVPNVRVDLRVAGSEDFPLIDADGDRVYGKITEAAGVFTLNFFSEVGGAETAYTFGATAPNIDFRYILRTNMSVIPVGAIVNGGAGFVEGATDATAYMNLNQLMKDLYGGSGTLDNDGNANLAKSIVQQIADEITARSDADTAIRNDLASTADGKGANLSGVEVDADGNYVGVTVQAVLTELAQRMVDQEQGGGAEVEDTHTRDAASANGYFIEKTVANNGEFTSLEARIVDVETVTDAELKDHETRIVKLETEEEEEVFEATGGETQYLLVKGRAKAKSVLLFLNGGAQAPGINFEYILNGASEIIGFEFAPNVLSGGDASSDIPPDVIFVKYKKIL